ncbi:hypothetical protein VNO78_16056 [Psophocarpus tetragonolobus]|uniref:Uncharacterized protein n=1 Tax=Psophocarpus tetragonolobus TaxID=3891 RepID=A0AAN9SG45_PSOTE
MLNGREKLAILVLSLFFSLLMVCFCFILVIHFVMELAAVMNIRGRKHQEILWPGFCIALFLIFSFAFAVFATFSGCGMLYIVNSSIKIAPVPTPVEAEQQPAMV